MTNDRDTATFIGVDVGSASLRAGVFDIHGRRLGFAVRPIRQFNPRADVYEHASADIWAQLGAAVRAALAEAGREATTVRGLGFDATCSLVAVGADGAGVSVAEDGDPQRDIVMWMDHRALAEAEAINATGDPALAYVGGEVSVEMQLPKILWLARRFPDRHAATRRYFDLADYLVWRATGADVASVCTLTCKWNYLAHEQRFSASLLQAVGLEGLPGLVPARVLPLGAAAGPLSVTAAAALGLPPGIAVATGIIDAHAGGLALCAADPEGALAVISGTSCCHLVASRDPVMVPGVWGPYFGAMLPGWWLNEGGQSAAGSLLDWTLRQGDAWPALQAAAEASGGSVYEIANAWVAALRGREAEPTQGLHVLADHHGNRSPRADPHARGAILGLTLEQGADALARRYLATVQALAYGTRHIIEALNTAGHRIDRVLLTGGGAKNTLSLQEHADATGCDLHLLAEEDAVTLGAALLAATAGGAFADLQQAARAMVRPDRSVRADPARRRFHDAKYRVYLQLYDDGRRARRLMTDPPPPEESACSASA